jgi:hypothetical protein
VEVFLAKVFNSGADEDDDILFVICLSVSRDLTL